MSAVVIGSDPVLYTVVVTLFASLCVALSMVDVGDLVMRLSRGSEPTDDISISLLKHKNGLQPILFTNLILVVLAAIFFGLWWNTTDQGYGDTYTLGNIKEKFFFGACIIAFIVIISGHLYKGLLMMYSTNTANVRFDPAERSERVGDRSSGEVMATGCENALYYLHHVATMSFIIWGLVVQFVGQNVNRGSDAETYLAVSAGALLAAYVIDEATAIYAESERRINRKLIASNMGIDVKKIAFTEAAIQKIPAQTPTRGFAVLPTTGTMLLQRNQPATVLLEKISDSIASSSVRPHSITPDTFCSRQSHDDNHIAMSNAVANAFDSQCPHSECFGNAGIGHLLMAKVADRNGEHSSLPDNEYFMEKRAPLFGRADTDMKSGSIGGIVPFTRNVFGYYIGMGLWLHQNPLFKYVMSLYLLAVYVLVTDDGPSTAMFWLITAVPPVLISTMGVKGQYSELFYTYFLYGTVLMMSLKSYLPGGQADSYPFQDNLMNKTDFAYNGNRDYTYSNHSTTQVTIAATSMTGSLGYLLIIIVDNLIAYCTRSSPASGQTLAEVRSR